jgi:hypothetical protein
MTRQITLSSREILDQIKLAEETGKLIDDQKEKELKSESQKKIEEFIAKKRYKNAQSINELRNVTITA